MIKSIEIKNFEAHEDTNVEFSNGFNLIVGESDSGKSSIIRSAAAVVNNQWTKEMVRTGCNSCKIRMETEKGWVECERGEKINNWKCFDGNSIQEYKKVGIKVPDQVVEILGMGERDRGDVKELPNFMFQLEKHYMLSEVDGKKATSNLVARMMDNAIGLGGMEDLIRDLSSDLLKDKKWLTEKSNEITELKGEIIDEKIYNSYEDLIETISEYEKEIEGYENSINGAVRYRDEYGRLNNDLLRCKEDISKEIEDIEKIYQDNIETDNLIKCFNKYKETYDCLIGINCISNKDMELIENKYQEIMDIKEKSEIFKEADKYIKLVSAINLIREEEIKEIEDVLLDIEKKNKSIKEMRDILTDARNKYKEMMKLNKEIEEGKKKEDILDKEFHELKEELGVCPLCGGELK